MIPHISIANARESSDLITYRKCVESGKGRETDMTNAQT